MLIVKFIMNNFYCIVWVSVATMASRIRIRERQAGSWVQHNYVAHAGLNFSSLTLSGLF